MARSIYQFYAKGSSYEEMHRRNRDLCSRWAKYIPSTSFKFLVGGYNRSISQSRQREIIESFSYMAFLGKIDMKNPEITFGCFEERASLPHSMVQKKKTTGYTTDQDIRQASNPRLLQVYFGRLVCFLSRLFDSQLCNKLTPSRLRKVRLDLLLSCLT